MNIHKRILQYFENNLECGIILINLFEEQINNFPFGLLLLCLCMYIHTCVYVSITYVRE
jgi:hypothetical protein